MKNRTPKLKLRQKHNEDIQRILKSSGCLDTRGRIRYWKKELWAKFEQAGHSSLGFSRCKCNM